MNAMFGAPKVVVDESKIDELLSRGVAESIPSHESLKKLLMSGKRLRVKLGVDPTSPHIHVGRSVPLLKLRDFQELGHQVVFIVGDFTAVIGDTSDKDAERPMLDRKTIEANLRTYKAQVGKILDLSKTEFRKNSEWLGKLTYQDIGEHADVFSVADFVARENIARRLREGKRVSLREVLYPLMQGFDSVAIRADVELGGSDQRFNVLAGRPLQEKFGQPPQHCLLFSLVTDPSGKKMSSSWGNTINITDEPNTMFGKTMAIPDELVEQYFISMTRYPLTEIATALALHPRDAKIALAYEFVRMYHSAQAADRAKEHFVATFSEKKVPDDAVEIRVTEGESLADLLVGAGVVSSKGELRRLVAGGGVKVAGSEEKITDDSLRTLPHGTVLRLGKHKFVKIVR